MFGHSNHCCKYLRMVLSTLCVFTCGLWIAGLQPSYFFSRDPDITLHKVSNSRPIAQGFEITQDQVTVEPEKAKNDTDTRQEETKFKIPNIVHFNWFGKSAPNLKFYHLLSILSAYKVIKPEIIYFHTNQTPAGRYFDEVQKLVPTLKINIRDPPLKLFGETLGPSIFPTMHSNVDRLLVLKEYGGIFMDLDVFAVNPFDDLRKYTCVIGLETDVKVCDSVIIAEKTSFFLTLWLNAYLDDYHGNEWTYNSGKVPTKLAFRYPELVHVEKTSLERPNCQDARQQIWGNEKYDWKNKNYAIHILHRMIGKHPEPDAENIKQDNTTFGEIARYIYYDTTDFVKT